LSIDAFRFDQVGQTISVRIPAGQHNLRVMLR
jgi:hypothetical protein